MNRTVTVYAPAGMFSGIRTVTYRAERSAAVANTRFPSAVGTRRSGYRPGVVRRYASSYRFGSHGLYTGTCSTVSTVYGSAQEVDSV